MTVSVQGVSVAVLVPAYRPGPVLIQFARNLALAGFGVIVVIDDGSGPDYSEIFETLIGISGVRVLRHAINLGKGAALKTGMNCVLVDYPGAAGVITADADGQHLTASVIAVAHRFTENPDALVLGSRAFTGYVPVRSRLGNSITHAAMRIVAGQKLSDTQTGLRAIPRRLMKRMLSVAASGYEFELEMLIAAKHLGFSIIEEPIQTIYEAGNPTSHFEPLRDSMRIYFVLLRFAMIAMLTAVLDNLLFYTFFRGSGNVAASLFGARLIALGFNYAAVRKAVFLSREQHRIALPRYLMLAAANICLSYSLITFLSGTLALTVMAAKIAVESVLFIANFAIQRDFVFANRAGRQFFPSQSSK